MATGLFQLKTPADLLAKLKHDLKRLSHGKTDPYPAFDFFITAEHLVDWVFPGSEADRRKMWSEPLLALCSHLANGSKHFEATARHHKSVSDSHEHHGGFSDEFSSDFDVSGLIILLDGDAKVQYGPQIQAHDLAVRVVEYWENWMKLNGCR